MCCRDFSLTVRAKSRQHIRCSYSYQSAAENVGRPMNPCRNPSDADKNRGKEKQNTRFGVIKRNRCGNGKRECRMARGKRTAKGVRHQLPCSLNYFKGPWAIIKIAYYFGNYETGYKRGNQCHDNQFFVLVPIIPKPR